MNVLATSITFLLIATRGLWGDDSCASERASWCGATGRSSMEAQVPGVLACYIQGSSFKRSGLAPFHLQDVPKDSCTHIVYSYVGVNPKTGELDANASDYEDPMCTSVLKQLSCFKKAAKNVKLILTYGNGWNFQELKDLLQNEGKQQKFADSVLHWLSKYEFDGISLHWEGPGPTLCGPDTPKLYKLLEIIREKLQPNKKELIVQLPACRLYCVGDLNLAKLAGLVDYVFLMAYNYHYTEWGVTDGHSKVYRRDIDPTDRPMENTEDCVGTWADAKVPKYKLILGIPFYGKSFTLNNVDEHGIRSQTNRHHPKGSMGPITQTEGCLGYMEICRYLRHMGYVREWDHGSQTPYAYKGDQWVGYDDNASVSKKVRFMMKNKLGGVYLWSLDLDDYRGDCELGLFPLLQETKTTFGAYKAPTWPCRGTRGSRIAFDKCDFSDGTKVPDHKDCTKYYICVNGKKQKRSCSKGKVWHTRRYICVSRLWADRKVCRQ